MNLQQLNKAILAAADEWAAVVPFGTDEEVSASSVKLIDLVNRRQLLLAKRKAK